MVSNGKPRPPSDAEIIAGLNQSVRRWRDRAMAEAQAGAHWRLLAAVLLARLPERMTEITLAEVGELRALGLSIDEHETPDGSYVVRLHDPKAEARPADPTAETS